MSHERIGRIDGVEHHDRGEYATVQRCRWLPLDILMRHAFHYTAQGVSPGSEPPTKAAAGFCIFSQETFGQL